MRKYETIVVYNSELPADQIKSEIARVETALKNNQAESLKVDQWGRTEMTFRRKGQRHGFYVSFGYSSANYGIVEAITALLRITDSVLLFQTHSVLERQRKFKGRMREGDKIEGGLDDLMEAY